MKNETDNLQTIFMLTNRPIVSLKTKQLADHPLNKEVFGDFPQSEYDLLKEDIRQRGIQDPLHVIKRDEKYIVISGHQRKYIATDLKIDVPCIIRSDLKEDWQVEEQLIKDNLLRRHLTDYQRYESGKRLEPIEKQRAKERQIRKPDSVVENLPPQNKGKSRDKVAEQLGVSGRQYDKIKLVGDKAPKDIKKKWKEKTISTYTAYERTRKHIRKKEREQKKEENEKNPISKKVYKNIKNMDCIQFLKDVKNNSVDLILTDPPYEISRKTGFITMTGEGVDRLGVSMDFGEWDKNFKDLDIVIDEFYRILRPNGTLIIFYDLWKITKLANMLDKAKFKQLRFIEWIKTNPVPLNSKINYLTNTREIALTAVKKSKPTFNSEYDNGVYSFPIFQNGERFHPTQKPVALFDELIKKHSDKNDVVLDCFLGSGTTVISAKKLERKFMGCEIDKKYYDLMIKRLNNGKETRK